MADYTRGWNEWLSDNLIRGSDKNKIKTVLLRRGFPEAFIIKEMKRLDESTEVAAARKIFKRTKKLESLLDVQSKLFRHSGFQCEFGERRQLSGDQFYKDYFFRNRPVVVTGWMDDWEALRTWSPKNFRQRFGEVEIEIIANRDKDPYYEDNCEQLRQKILLREFVDTIESAGSTNAVYLVARNFLLSKPEFAELKNEFVCPTGVLDPTVIIDRHVKLWMGPGGTVTPLHHDASNILFGQVYGRKHIKLIPPHDIRKVYNDRRCFSAVDLNCPDFERFPLLKEATILDVIIGPGEFLFLPVGWWHWVKALEPSISLSFLNLYHGSPQIVWAHAS
jgi:ribosomal protein L16 Arg81 hydroxylase